MIVAFYGDNGVLFIVVLVALDVLIGVGWLLVVAGWLLVLVPYGLV